MMNRAALSELPNNGHQAPSRTDKLHRESFDDIYLNLSKKPGKCRIAESGVGWKPTGGDTFTLDKAEFLNAQWSRASRGYELKIFARNEGVVLLDGFKQDVSGLENAGE